MNPTVVIKMASGDKMKVELYLEIAPITVNNFITLVKKGFYNGTIFHSIISDFMIQGGDLTGTRTGNLDILLKESLTQMSLKINYPMNVE